jgi:hypothetical protein
MRPIHEILNLRPDRSLRSRGNGKRCAAPQLSDTLTSTAPHATEKALNLYKLPRRWRSAPPEQKAAVISFCAVAKQRPKLLCKKVARRVQRACSAPVVGRDGLELMTPLSVSEIAFRRKCNLAKQSHRAARGRAAEARTPCIFRLFSGCGPDKCVEKTNPPRVERGRWSRFGQR